MSSRLDVEDLGESIMNVVFVEQKDFFRPAYAGHLLDEWIPAMSGVEEKLKMGAKVADIGCGLGTSSMLMAEQYPNSTIHAFDFHEPSIEEAKKRAEERGYPI